MRMIWKTSDYKEIRSAAYNISGESWNDWQPTVQIKSFNIHKYVVCAGTFVDI